MDKTSQLDNLKQEILKDEALPFRETANNLVFGEANPDAEILFLGEAPGRFEDLSGRPFVGQAGKILDRLLSATGLERKDVFITSVLQYRPPKNRDPKPSEIKAFAPYIDQLINIISPNIIVTLGRHSLNKFLPEARISEVHGKPHKINWGGKNITVIPMYHPASALYRRDLLKVLEKDFRVILEIAKEEKIPLI
jgi:uracil-DNA glycosylase